MESLQNQVQSVYPKNADNPVIKKSVSNITNVYLGPRKIYVQCV